MEELQKQLAGALSRIEALERKLDNHFRYREPIFREDVSIIATVLRMLEGVVEELDTRVRLLTKSKHGR